jgi:hypothetical protein
MMRVDAANRGAKVCVPLGDSLTDAQELKTLDNPAAAIDALETSSSEFSDAVESEPDEQELAELERDKLDAPFVPLIDERKSHFAEIPPMLRVPGVSVLDVQRTMALSAELGGECVQPASDLHCERDVADPPLALA